MALPNPEGLEFEYGGSPYATIPRPLTLEIEFAGSAVRVGQGYLPSIEGLEVEFSGRPAAGAPPTPLTLQIEYGGGSVPLHALGKPGVRGLEIEYNTRPIPPPAARPSMLTFALEFEQFFVAAGTISAIFDGTVPQSSLSKATYVDVFLASNVFPRSLLALPVVSGDTYFSDETNWHRVFVVYVKQGTTDKTFFARHFKAPQGVWVGDFVLRSPDETGVYDKCVLLEGNDGRVLVVPSTDVNEPLTIAA